MVEPWNKYDKGKMLGGIFKRGRKKGQEEVMTQLKTLLKVSDKDNIETIAAAVNSIANEVSSISQRLTVIEQKLGITQQVKQS